MIEQGTSVSVLCMDKYDVLRYTLNALHRTLVHPYEVILVDNGSTDPRVCIMLEDYKDKMGWRLITNVVNMGLSIGVNQGLFEGRYDTLIHLDDDCMLHHQGWNQIMRNYLISHAKIGLVVPGSGREFIKRNGYKEIRWGLGFCWAMRKSLYDDIGGYDPQLLHQNECDLALRVRMSGYHVAGIDEFNAIHNDPGGQRSEISLAREHLGVVQFRDKWCVHGDARVRTDKGTTSLSGIVNSNTASLVSSLDNGIIVNKKITGRYRNNRCDRNMLHISYVAASGQNVKRGKNSKASDYGVWVTEDHPVLTESGWKKAGELVDGKDRLITAEPAPTSEQLALLVGSILGDSSLGKCSDKRVRSALVMAHCSDQLEWLDLKCNALSGFQYTKNRTSNKLNGKVYTGYRASFKKLAYWSDLERSFYSNRVKRVPFDLVESALALHPGIFLATWYLDDGCFVSPHFDPETESSRVGRPRGIGQARIATHGFTELEVSKLAELLTRYGFESKSIQHKVSGYKTYYGLRFTAEGTKSLYELIGKYVPPSLRYKLPEWADSYNDLCWTLGPALRYAALVKIKTSNDTRMPDYVYCIDVEDTHNFIINNVIVHNCQYFRGKDWNYGSIPLYLMQHWPPDQEWYREYALQNGIDLNPPCPPDVDTSPGSVLGLTAETAARVGPRRFKIGHGFYMAYVDVRNDYGYWEKGDGYLIDRQKAIDTWFRLTGKKYEGYKWPNLLKP